MPNRSHFNISYSELMKLPIPVKNKMVEKLNQWRAEEKAMEKSE